MYKRLKKENIINSCISEGINSEYPIQRRLSLLVLTFLLKESQYSFNIRLAIGKVLTTDFSGDVRRHAAWLLRYLDREEALNLAIQALTDEDMGVRFEAVEALAVLSQYAVEGGDEDNDNNDNDNADHDNDDNTDLGYECHLRDQEEITKKAIGGIVRALDDTQYEVRLRAAFHLHSLNPKEVEAAINAVFPECAKPIELYF